LFLLILSSTLFRSILPIIHQPFTFNGEMKLEYTKAIDKTITL
jgi:hypothetical protein